MSKFLKEVRAGMAGANRGVPGGLPDFDKAVHNTQHGKIYGIMGSSKAGKTALVLQRYIVYPYLSGEEIDWIWYSIEISRSEVIARLLSTFALIHSKQEVSEDINKKVYRIHWTKVYSYGDNKLSEEEYVYLEKIYKIYIEPLLGVEDEEGNTIKEGRIEFIDDIGQTNPTGIRNHLLNVAEKYGEIEWNTFNVKDDFGKSVVKRSVKKYRPKSKRRVWVIVDHLGLMKKEDKMSKKENIDKFVEEYARGFKNQFGFTFILVSQQNRGIKGVDRLKFNGEDLQPQSEDLKDSSSLEEVSDMLIAIFNPNSFQHLKSHMKYSLQDFEGGYRSLHVVVSRYTKTPIIKCVYFDSITGRFVELEKPNTKELESQISQIKKLSK